MCVCVCVCVCVSVCLCICVCLCVCELNFCPVWHWETSIQPSFFASHPPTFLFVSRHLPSAPRRCQPTESLRKPLASHTRTRTRTFSFVCLFSFFLLMSTIWTSAVVQSQRRFPPEQQHCPCWLCVLARSSLVCLVFLPPVLSVT